MRDLLSCFREFFPDPCYPSFSIRRVLDALSCSYFGDFLFFGRPVTERYHQSWMRRVRLPYRPAWLVRAARRAQRRV